MVKTEVVLFSEGKVGISSLTLTIIITIIRVENKKAQKAGQESNLCKISNKYNICKNKNKMI